MVVNAGVVPLPVVFRGVAALPVLVACIVSNGGLPVLVTPLDVPVTHPTARSGVRHRVGRLHPRFCDYAAKRHEAQPGAEGEDHVHGRKIRP